MTDRSTTLLPAGGMDPAHCRRMWMTVALLFACSFLNYLDRQSLSVLEPVIKSTLHIDDAGYAVIVNIFTFCYAFAYIASGWLVDRVGVRIALTIYCVLWSVASIGTGLMQTFAGFALCRGLLGVAEPGQYPSAIRATTLWIPPTRRGFLMSLSGAGGTIASIVAVPAIAWLATAFSWHAAFIVPGAVGLFLAATWWWYYRDPETTGFAADSEVARLVPPLPWRSLWRQNSLWGIVLARFISDPVWYFCLFWMPGYLQEKRGLGLAEVGFVGWIPFFVANIGALGAATFSDRLGRRWNDTLRARRNLLIAAAALGPLAMIVPHLPWLGLAIATLSVIGVICLTWLFIMGPLVADVFPAGNVASVWSIAGAFGATGAIIFNYFIGQISSTLGADRIFYVMGFLHPIAAVLMALLVKRVRPETDFCDARGAGKVSSE
ncbi:L-galactonate transporter [mine drainage metagenome]|uniref:L-galactonate transporter n=1 Tax=mine drainage metagenome TaxID=410659 RepID=A0A1J5TFE2_9ZZZZ